MSALCKARLQEERKQWRKDQPYGFWARPEKKTDGTMNIMEWSAGIPGKAGGAWEGATYKVQITFPDDYPQKPPKCKFVPTIFHPNIYPSGTVCLSILNEDQDWKPAITMKQILLGIQELLDTPNLDSPAETHSYNLLKRDPKGYDRKVRENAREYARMHNAGGV